MLNVVEQKSRQTLFRSAGYNLLNDDSKYILGDSGVVSWSGTKQLAWQNTARRNFFRASVLSEDATNV